MQEYKFSMTPIFPEITGILACFTKCLVILIQLIKRVLLKNSEKINETG